MADVDPKELVKKNAALVVVYVLALVPIGLWFVLVDGGVKGSPRDRNSFMGKAQQLKQQGAQINTFAENIKHQGDEGATPVYTDANLKAFQDEKALKEQQLDAMRQLIIDRDQALEKWFDKYQGKSERDIDPNDYITYYRTQLAALEEEYKDILTVEEGGEPKIDKLQPNAQELRRFQKRFWIQSALFASFKEAGQGQIKVLDKFSFIPAPTSGGEQKKGPVERLQVKGAVLAPLSMIPALVKALLSRDISIQVSELVVEKASFYIEQPKVELVVDGRERVFDDLYYSVLLDKASDFAAPDSYISEPAVKVGLTIEVLDFDVEKPAPEEKKDEEE